MMRRRALLLLTTIGVAVMLTGQAALVDIAGASHADEGTFNQVEPAVLAA